MVFWENTAASESTAMQEICGEDAEALQHVDNVDIYQTHYETTNDRQHLSSVDVLLLLSKLRDENNSAAKLHDLTNEEERQF